MSLYKASQSFLEGTDYPMMPDTNSLQMPPDLVVIDPEHLGEVMSLQEHEEKEPELSLTLPEFPGAEDASEIPVMEVKEEPKPTDPMEWTVKTFMPWLDDKMKNCPRHSGKDSAGLERIISYFEWLDGQISKAVRQDFKNDLPIDLVEKARDEIRKGLDRLKDRLDKVQAHKYPKKKKSELENEMIKMAGTTKINGITITVDLAISAIARECINSMVSVGHDIERTLEKLGKEYNLTKRERFEVIALLSDMGYYVSGDGESLDKPEKPSSSDQLNHSSVYYA